MNWRKPAAASWFLLPAKIASELPPFSEVAGVPAVHSGMGATRQSPLPAVTPLSRSTPIQPPVTRPAIEPLARPVYQALLHELIGARSPPLISGDHRLTNFCVPASDRLMVTFLVPLVTNGWPPASQIIDVTKPGSPVSLARYSFGLAECSFLASAAYCAQVVGTVRWYLSKMV